jgi:hypothetical protein
LCAKRKIKVSQLGYDGKEQIVHLIKSGNTMGHKKKQLLVWQE